MSFLGILEGGGYLELFFEAVAAVEGGCDGGGVYFCVLLFGHGWLFCVVVCLWVEVVVGEA